MHKKTLHPMYEAESGGAGGAPAPEGKDPAGDDKAVFTPEQQAKIDELIGKAFAKAQPKRPKKPRRKPRGKSRPRPNGWLPTEQRSKRRKPS